MNVTLKRIVCLALVLAGLCALMPVGNVGVSAYAAADYTDVPQGHWAYDNIYSAREAGLMSGLPDGSFGLGNTMLRRDFAIILCRMFGWELISPAAPSFSDVAAGGTYYTYIETVVHNGAVAKTAKYEPDRAITRGEMAVMLVKALGYDGVAADPLRKSTVFTDVGDDIAGYISIAADIGMTTGLSATQFGPDQTATREQVAAMMMRVWDKLNSKLGWLHGFYAFSSYSQKDLITKMDAVSLGWARLRLDTSGVWLNTSSTGSNEWAIPPSYETITDYLRDISTPAHLNVFMSMDPKVTLSDGSQQPELRQLLSSAEHRETAVSRIVSEVTRTYAAINRSPYSGVTIDFEGLKAQDKDNFTAFVQLLSERLKAAGLSLYVAVQPVVPGEEHYDGFDYRAIGQCADKVILMAHDYQARTLVGLEGTSTWHTRTALTPLNKVYSALKAITHSETGVADTSKIALAISFSTIGWKLDEQGRLLSGYPVTPSTETLKERLAQPDAVIGWSDTYHNPYVKYTTADGTYYVWYENARSVQDKITLAKLFGIQGLSVWRLGTIPSYPGVYDVWQTILSNR